MDVWNDRPLSVSTLSESTLPDTLNAFCLADPPLAHYARVSRRHCMERRMCRKPASEHRDSSAHMLACEERLCAVSV